MLGHHTRLGEHYKGIVKEKESNRAVRLKGTIHRALGWHRSCSPWEEGDVGKGGASVKERPR